MREFALGIAAVTFVAVSGSASTGEAVTSNLPGRSTDRSR